MITRRNFFGQLFAGLAGCIFFPLINKSKYAKGGLIKNSRDKIPIWLTPNESLINPKTIKEIPITFIYKDLNGNEYHKDYGFAKMYIDKKNIKGFQITYEKNLV